MGRIAQALDRAERERWQNAPASAPALPLPLSKNLNKWASWYGSAAADTETVAPTPPGPQRNGTDGPTQPGLAEDIVSYYARSSLVSEQYRSLRTRLMAAGPAHDHRIYAVASAMPGDGKTVTTVNLGFCFAEVAHLRVLLVDADLRRGSLAKMLNSESAPGLADVLLDTAPLQQALRPTPVPNLSFLPAGDTRGRSLAELLSSPAARAAFTRMQREFHCTIVDTPSAAMFADVEVIGQMTSGVIFVVRMHRTPEPLAKKAVRHIVHNNIPILGAVVIGDNDPTGAFGCDELDYRYAREGRP